MVAKHFVELVVSEERTKGAFTHKDLTTSSGARHDKRTRKACSRSTGLRVLHRLSKGLSSQTLTGIEGAHRAHRRGTDDGWRSGRINEPINSSWIQWRLKIDVAWEGGSGESLPTNQRITARWDPPLKFSKK
jgi:hypothetical protein